MAMNKWVLSSVLFGGIFPLSALVSVDLCNADDLVTYEITLQDHHFTPSEIHVPSGKPFIVLVTNRNDGSDEFEMLFPALERPLQPGQQGKVRIRPLAPGRFPFFGESDPDNETGAFVAE
jgi:Cupredoxin-like domain